MGEPSNFGVIGRNILKASRPDVLDAISVGKILKLVMPLHKENSDKIEKLHSFYRGDQDILERTKEARPEITHNIVENRAYEIVQFKKGYEFSNPVQYVNIGLPEMNAHVEMLNKFARADGRQSKDLSTAKRIYISGNGYKLCLQNPYFDSDSAPYITTVLDPSETFIVYSSDNGIPIIAGKFVSQIGDDGKSKIYRTFVYTDTATFEWVSDDKDFEEYDEVEPENVGTNGIGIIPIIEYVNDDDRIGHIEVVYDLLNALNTLASNRVEDVEQFVQSLLVLINTELKQDPNNPEKYIVPRTGDVLMIGNGTVGADAKFLSAQLSQSDTQILADCILRTIYRIVGIPTPGNQGQAQSGGSTGQAEFVRNDWGLSDSRSMTTLAHYEESERQLLRVILNICRATQAVDIGDITLHDIKVQTTRNKFDNIQMKSQTLQVLLRSGVPFEDAALVADLFPDISAVKARMDIIDKELEALEGNQGDVSLDGTDDVK